MSKGREYKFQHHIVDRHFFTDLFVVKFVMCFLKIQNKLKRGRGWTFLKNICKLLQNF